jgi:hypothetical protein
MQLAATPEAVPAGITNAGAPINPPANHDCSGRWTSSLCNYRECDAETGAGRGRAPAPRTSPRCCSLETGERHQFGDLLSHTAEGSWTRAGTAGRRRPSVGRRPSARVCLTRSGPTPVRIVRSGLCPLRTNSRRPDPSRRFWPYSGLGRLNFASQATERVAIRIGTSKKKTIAMTAPILTIKKK